MSDVVRFWGPVFIIAAILVTLAIILMKKFKKAAFCKYIPTLILWIVSISLFVVAIFFADSMKDLGYLVMAMITGLGTLIAMLITIVIDYLLKRKNNNDKK